MGLQHLGLCIKKMSHRVQLFAKSKQILVKILALRQYNFYGREEEEENLILPIVHWVSELSLSYCRAPLPDALKRCINFSYPFSLLLYIKSSLEKNLFLVIPNLIRETEFTQSSFIPVHQIGHRIISKLRMFAV